VDLLVSLPAGRSRLCHLYGTDRHMHMMTCVDLDLRTGTYMCSYRTLHCTCRPRSTCRPTCRPTRSAAGTGEDLKLLFWSRSVECAARSACMEYGTTVVHVHVLHVDLLPVPRSRSRSATGRSRYGQQPTSAVSRSTGSIYVRVDLDLLDLDLLAHFLSAF